MKLSICHEFIKASSHSWLEAFRFGCGDFAVWRLVGDQRKKCIFDAQELREIHRNVKYVLKFPHGDDYIG